MRPLGLLFLTRTAAPTELLFQETERLFNLLSVGIRRVNFTRCEREIIRPPVAAAVCDHQDRMAAASYFSLGVSIAMGPGRPERLLTELAVTFESHHISPPPPL